MLSRKAVHGGVGGIEINKIANSYDEVVETALSSDQSCSVQALLSQPEVEKAMTSMKHLANASKVRLLSRFEERLLAYHQWVP